MHKVGLAFTFAKKQLKESWGGPGSVLSVIAPAETSVLFAEASTHSRLTSCTAGSEQLGPLSHRLLLPVAAVTGS